MDGARETTRAGGITGGAGGAPPHAAASTSAESTRMGDAFMRLPGLSNPAYPHFTLPRVASYAQCGSGAAPGNVATPHCAAPPNVTNRLSGSCVGLTAKLPFFATTARVSCPGFLLDSFTVTFAMPTTPRGLR